MSLVTLELSLGKRWGDGVALPRRGLPGLSFQLCLRGLHYHRGDFSSEPLFPACEMGIVVVTFLKQIQVYSHTQEAQDRPRT